VDENRSWLTGEYCRIFLDFDDVGVFGDSPERPEILRLHPAKRVVSAQPGKCLMRVADAPVNLWRNYIVILKIVGFSHAATVPYIF
jgi:hypothetical protein